MIRDLYPDPHNSLRLIASKLKNRTPESVKRRASILKVRRVGLSKYRSKKFKGKGNPFYGKQHTEATKQKIAQTVRENTCFPGKSKELEFQIKRRAGLKTKPNRLEILLQGIIEEACPGRYRYSGDGSFLIDGLNPDWIWEEGHKAIELFGEFFHDQETNKNWKLSERSQESGRRKVFAEHGYEMLVIWDFQIIRVEKSSDCSARDKLIRRIRKYTLGAFQ